METSNLNDRWARYAAEMPGGLEPEVAADPHPAAWVPKNPKRRRAHRPTAQVPQVRQRVVAAQTGMSSRQKEVVKRLSEGLTIKEIAMELGVSKKTIEFHSARARQNIGSASIAILTRYAIRTGLSPLLAADDELVMI